MHLTEPLIMPMMLMKMAKPLPQHLSSMINLKLKYLDLVSGGLISCMEQGFNVAERIVTLTSLLLILNATD